MLTAVFSLSGDSVPDNLDAPVVSVPAAFFARIGYRGFVDLMARRNGITNARETRFLWSLLRRGDVAPKSIQLIFRRTDVLIHHPPDAHPTGSLPTALDKLWRILVEN